MRDIKAKNTAELIKLLKSIDINVPPRNRGRNTDHCETWTICRLLATLTKTDKIDFPLQLIKRERPDFLLKAGDRGIGIEVTEAINPEYAKATTLPEADDDSVIDPSYFKWCTPQRKLNDLRSIVSRKKLTGPGWEGNSVETEYAAAIMDVITRKTEKLRTQGFEKFSENWLAIYCNIMLPALNLDEANGFLVKKVTNYWAEDSFSNIFVEKGDSIIWYSPPDRITVLELVDLWRDG